MSNLLHIGRFILNNKLGDLKYCSLKNEFSNTKKLFAVLLTIKKNSRHWTLQANLKLFVVLRLHFSDVKSFAHSEQIKWVATLTQILTRLVFVLQRLYAPRENRISMLHIHWLFFKKFVQWWNLNMKLTLLGKIIEQRFSDWLCDEAFTLIKFASKDNGNYLEYMWKLYITYTISEKKLSLIKRTKT